MKIKELIEQLQQYDKELEVGVIVEFTDHSDCGRRDGGYCYCSSEEYKKTSLSVHEEREAPKGRKVKKVWIHADY